MDGDGEKGKKKGTERKRRGLMNVGHYTQQHRTERDETETSLMSKHSDRANGRFPAHVISSDTDDVI